MICIPLISLMQALSFRPYEVDVMNVPSAKKIVIVKASNIKSNFYSGLAGPGVEDLVNTTDVNFHCRQRRLLQGAFLRNHQGLSPDCGEAHLSDYPAHGGGYVYTWGCRCVHVVEFMAIDAIGELTFGESIQILGTG